MTILEAGEFIMARDNYPPVARMGIPPQTRGQICYVGEGRVSFVLFLGSTPYKGCADRTDFDRYFHKTDAVTGGPTNPDSQASSHFDKAFPDLIP